MNEENVEVNSPQSKELNDVESIENNQNTETNKEIEILFDQGDKNEQSTNNQTITSKPINPKPSTNEEQKVKPNPLTYTFFLFRITFEYVTSLVWTGFKRQLQMEDIWDLRPQDKSEVMSEYFESEWNKRKDWKGKWAKYSLFCTLLKVIGFRWYFAGVCALLADLSFIIGPYLISLIIRILELEDGSILHALYLTIGLLVLQVFGVTCSNLHFYNTNVVSVRIKSALTSVIFKKALRLSNKSRGQKTTGEITNLMSLDAFKVGEFLIYMWMGNTGPILVAIILGFLIYFIGWVCVVGIFITFLAFIIQGVVLGLWMSFRNKILKHTDARVKNILEILQGIRVIKFFNWEESFLKKVNKIRSKEYWMLYILAVLRAIVDSVLGASPIVVCVCTFLVYVAIGNELTAEKVFSSIAYFHMLQFPLLYMVMVASFFAEALVSCRRIQEFLRFEERTMLEPGNDHEYPIKAEHCYFEWDASPEKKVKNSKQKKNDTKNEEKNETSKIGKLEDITFSVKKGELCCIVGKVGSGKSSICQGLIGEMRLVKGKVSVTGRVAYCAQTAWIQNATVRDNILFGSPYDEEKYKKIIDVCALRADLDILEHGDQTEIGEKGITISGGQRQRIALARAIYNDADVYIFDDPLSAVDAHVGKHIFEKCINGFLKDKTRLLVTHQLQYLQYSTSVLVFDDGKIVEQGTYQELMEKKNGILQNLIKEHLSKESEQDKQDDMKKKEIEEEKKRAKSKAHEEKGQLMQEEERAIGAVSLKVYWTYFKNGGGLLMFLLLFVTFVLCQVFYSGSDVWMSIWISERIEGLPNWGYFGVYAGTGLLAALFVFISSSLFWGFGLIAANNLFNKAFKRIIRAPMWFFDTTPMGRILSRFSKDQEALDTRLIEMLSQVLYSFSQVAATLVVIAIVSPWFLIPLVPILIIYFVIQQLFRSSAREIKRLESLTRSPLYAHFSESLIGLSTIRSYKKQDLFIQTNQKHINKNLRTTFALLMTQRWLTFRLEMIGALLMFFASIFVIITKDNIDSSLGALAISLAYPLTQLLGYMVINFADAETQMNAVERMAYYLTVPNEPSDINDPKKQPANWPSEGSIEFNSFVMRYRPNLPPVLKGLTFKIKGGEKIGVVGRTGAGKSSIMLALYRMVEPDEGYIAIDGIKISDINLGFLRKKLSIIPQEPTLFSGTIRSNLDPFNEFGDQTLWEVLEKAHLKEVVEKLDKKLESPVVEGGENFSVGQRQLMCLARALCLKTKILILDECTASVDIHTDALIQQTIDKEFKDCTRLTIAHRLNTIIKSDRILVMDKGQVAEFGTPKELLEKEDGIFIKMVNETGSANARTLRNIAFGIEEEAEIPASE